MLIYEVEGGEGDSKEKTKEIWVRGLGAWWHRCNGHMTRSPRLGTQCCPPQSLVVFMDLWYNHHSLINVIAVYDNADLVAIAGDNCLQVLHVVSTLAYSTAQASLIIARCNRRATRVIS